MRDYALETTFDIKFTTRRFSTGAPFTLAGTPAVAAYPGNSTTEITAGITLTVDFDARTGLHNVRVVATAANGYATNTNYALVLTAGTVDSVSVVGEVIGEFSIEAQSPLRPTTAARTLDVSAGGEAGVDWANVGSPTTTLALTNTTIATTQKVDVETIKTNPVVNGGTITFPTTATLASTTNITAGTVTTATNVTTVNGLAANVITAAATAADFGAEIATAIWTDTTAGDFTVAASIGKSIMNGVALGTGLTIGSVSGAVGSISAGGISAASFVAGAIDATAMNVTGSEFTAIPWNAAWDAEVQSEVEDAIVVHRLDELLNADSDIDGAAPPTVGSVFHELMSKTAGSFTFDQTTDSCEAIRDKLTDIETDTAEIGAAGAGLTNINLPNQTMDIVGNITGNLSGSVGSVTGAVGSVTGAVGSVTGAVGSVTGAVGSVTGNVGGNVTGSVGSLAAQAKADVNAEVVDALATDTYAEPGQGAPAATTTLATKLGFLYKAWRNRHTQTSSEYALYADDTTTKDQEAAVSDDTITFDRGEVGTGA